jgi:hypothetical protein
MVLLAGRGENCLSVLVIQRASQAAAAAQERTDFLLLFDVLSSSHQVGCIFWLCGFVPARDSSDFYCSVHVRGARPNNIAVNNK